MTISTGVKKLMRLVFTDCNQKTKFETTHTITY